jgi:hypothetical protein
MISRSTTYNDHFTPRTHTELQPNTKADYSIGSRLSQRPWTDESRGKYNTEFPTGPIIDPLSDEEEEEEDEHEEGGEGGNKLDTNPPTGLVQGDRVIPAKQAPAGNNTHQHNLESTELGYSDGATPKVQTSEAETQTDEAYFEESNTELQPQQPTHKLPLMIRSPSSDALLSRNPIDALTAKLYKLPTLNQQRPATAPVPSPQKTTTGIHSLQGQSVWDGDGLYTAREQELEHRKGLLQPSVSQKFTRVPVETDKDPQPTDAECTPRTVESTRRMMEVFNGFSRSTSMRQFHQCYQESVTPDLRQFSRQGKRHVIHGIHAYHYH